MNNDSQRNATSARIRQLFEQFRASGLSPNDAAARAVQEIRNVKTSSNDKNDSSKSTESSSTPQNPKVNLEEPSSSKTDNQENPKPSPPSPKCAFATTSAVEFLEHLKDSSNDDLVTHIENIFGHPMNLASSFQLKITNDIDEMAIDSLDVNSEEEQTVLTSSSNVDWDGLKRVYDEIEERGNILEAALVEATKRYRRELKDVPVDLIRVSLTMILINPHIASPSYLDAAFIGMCRYLAELTPAEDVEMVKVLSVLSSQDLLQIVRNVQQYLTIRTLEIDENVDIHEDEKISCLVKTLRLLFFATLLGRSEDSDWRSNLQKHSTYEIEEESEMEVDQNVVIPEMSEDEKQIDEILHSQKEQKTNVDQDPIAKKLKLDWCKISKPRIPYDEFLNETINNALDVEKDFVNLTFRNDEEWDAEIFSFMKNPFILSLKQKTIYLFYDSRVKQIQHRRRAHISNMLNGTLSLPYFIIKVSRDNIIQDALTQLEIVAADNPGHLQKQLVVEFDGEQGIDEGGVSKEFFTIALEEIFKPDYGMFRFNEDTGYHQFNPIQFQETEKEYMLIGMILGLAIYNSINLDIAFPTVIFKKLLDYEGTFEDLEFSHPDVYRNMTILLEADKDTVDSMTLTFTAGLTSMFDEVVHYDLVKNGKDKAVNNKNKFHFVEVYADFLLNKSIQKSFNAFKRGFELVTDNSPLPDLFRPEELEHMVIGQRKYDWEVLEETCEYDGGYNKEHPTIKNFWLVFNEMDEKDKKMFLEFCTGSDRVPVGGLMRLKVKIQSSGPDSDRLPTAHTCFNVLLLPAYETIEKLKERLTKAIENAKGFGMI